jgi:hypothetical protein
MVPKLQVAATCFGIGLDIGFTDRLYARLGTTSNYIATANLHDSQITTTRLKPFSSLLCLQPFPGNGF